MIIAAQIVGAGLIALAVIVLIWLYQEFKAPAAPRTLPLPDAGGSQAGFDILPCVTSSLASVPPFAGRSPPSGLDPLKLVRATGRDLNKDYYCAEDVAITITDREVWLEVDKDNLLRVKRIKRLVLNDWRASASAD